MSNSSEQGTTAITPQDAFNKYFGTALELANSTYPFKCKGGNGRGGNCVYILSHLDQDWESHIRHDHDQKIMSQKQIDRIIERQKEAAELELRKRQVTI